MSRQIFIIIVMVALSAFFSASEISFNSANKLRLKKAAEAGSRSAALACRMCDDYMKALSAILIGNNLANIAASTAATVLTMELLLSLRGVGSDGLASVISSVLMTLVILVFGEIVPKIIARENADTLVRFFAYPTRFLMIVLYPAVWVVMRLISLFRRLWGSDSEEEPTVTEEELSSIIETVEEEGVIDGEKGELLQSTLDFRDTNASEIMTPRVDFTVIDIDDTPLEIKRTVDSSRYSRIPVYEDSVDNIIGILYLNRYYKAIAAEGEEEDGVRFRERMREELLPPCFVHKTMKLPALLALMRGQRMHLAVVTDEYGGTLGIVTMEDILEELVGEIWDESDEIVTECRRTGEDSYEVSGDMNLDDFFAEIEFDPRGYESEYSTVGGFAIEMLDADPHTGDSFRFPPEPCEDDDSEPEEGQARAILVTVATMDERRVTGLKVKLLYGETGEKTEE